MENSKVTAAELGDDKIGAACDGAKAHYDVYPARGNFEPGMEVMLIAESSGQADRLRLLVTGRDREQFVFCTALKQGKNWIHLENFPGAPGGYGVEAEFYQGETFLLKAYTAFDVVTSERLIRYGFLSDFSEEDGGEADIISMLKLHINAVQFYDWSYRHDELVAPNDSYTDMMGKKNNRSVIREKVEACHRYGMKALAYGAVYAASAEYQRAHPEQSLYDSQGMPQCFIGTFYIMNISRESGWHEHILEQYRKAMEQMGFDGIHMDTYGEPKAALDWKGEPQYLEEQIAPMIDDAASYLKTEEKAPFLIFNNVGGWPLERTIDANQSAVYIEVWPPNAKYHHIGSLIREAKRGGKPVIMAAYPAAFRTCDPEAGLESQLHLSFVIAMHGATQIFFGEQNAVITQGYYADYTVLKEEQLSMVRAYQDFFVRYGEFFYDEKLSDVSMTHQGWDNREYVFTPCGSADGEPGTVWYHICQSRDTKVIYFVNLSENDDLWEEGKRRPAGKRKISAKIEALGKPKRVWFATPDEDHGDARECDWSMLEEKNEILVDVEVLRCGMLVMES